MAYIDTADYKQKQRMQMYDNISHQLASPLNVILNGAEYIQASLENGSPEQQREAIGLSAQAIRDSAHWLDRLAQNLLDLLAISSNSFCPTCRLLDLGAQLQRLLTLCAPYAAVRKIQMHWSTEQMPMQSMIRADEAVLDRIVLNLLSNALRFGHSNGNVWINLEPQEDGYGIVIQDDGPGLPAEVLEEVQHGMNEPVPQFPGHGDGLGLCIAAEFCRAMDWKLHLKSSEEGTTACVKIPIEKMPAFGSVTMESGILIQELRQQEQAGRVTKEMSALFGELK